ncbi:unnamed protein product [Fraxinus pennsylvanica]|uniref:Uncharacterized protein n=1 Tax=Fraxinus pennsylvanica TaxID=56036 RepID=A0AAD2EA02_9LAMI|nr:unnamed protein product [Fraxinus pennsylvanica]
MSYANRLSSCFGNNEPKKKHAKVTWTVTILPPRPDVKKDLKCPAVKGAILSSVHRDVEKCVKRPCTIHSSVRPDVEKCVKSPVKTSTVPPPTRCNLKICVNPNSDSSSGARAQDGAIKQSAAISTTIQIPVTLPCTVSIKTFN